MACKNSPPPPDYAGAAGQQYASSQQVTHQQTQANRPDQTNAFGTSSQWSQGPDGQWRQSSSFGGPLGGAVSGLESQAAQSMGQPLDFGGPMDNGSAARDQAITGAYNQATSRLNPRFDQQGEQLGAQLANQGLDPNSQAYRTAMQQFGQQKNDAYSSAMNNAIGQGTAAQQATFGENMAARQQTMAEMLRKREQPMQDLAGLQGLTQQQGFNAAGAAQAYQALPAAMAQGNYQIPAYEAQNQANADLWGGAMSLAGKGLELYALSDERAKSDIVRLPVEALPGVPFATWTYRPEHDASGRRHLGVIAQDLARVAPEYVRERADGLLEVDYSFLR